MKYGNEYRIKFPLDFDLQRASHAKLDGLFENAHCVSNFEDSPDKSYCHAVNTNAVKGGLVFRIDEDRLIEINDTIDRDPPAIKNVVEDVLSFQFVSRAKRTEFLGSRINVHDLGPAIIVTAIPGREETLRLAKPNERIRHVMIHTTLSTVMSRMGESLDEYPQWFRDVFEVQHGSPKQWVLFLNDQFRDIIWNCFQLTLEGELLKRWLCHKFEELLCVGLQLIKQNQRSQTLSAQNYSHSSSDKIVQARNILDKEYAAPPKVPELARRLGISETQLRVGFKALSGVCIRSYCMERRMEAAKYLISENRQSIAEIADIVGFQDQAAFSRAFKRCTGTTPSAWKKFNRTKR